MSTVSCSTSSYCMHMHAEQHSEIPLTGRQQLTAIVHAYNVAATSWWPPRIYWRMTLSGLLTMQLRG